MKTEELAPIVRFLFRWLTLFLGAFVVAALFFFNDQSVVQALLPVVVLLLIGGVVATFLTRGIEDQKH